MIEAVHDLNMAAKGESCGCKFIMEGSQLHVHVDGKPATERSTSEQTSIEGMTYKYLYFS